MTDLAITVSQVLPGSLEAGADFFTGIAAAAVTAGQTVYLNTSTQLALADADASAASARTKGVALHAASAGQPLKIQTGGPLTLGAAASMTVGLAYYQSPTAGGICPVGDVLAGDYVTLLGIATSASVLLLAILISGVQVPA